MIERERDPLDAGSELLERLQPFPNHGEVDECEARDVPTRTCQADHEALSDWIVDHREDDRDGVGRLFKRCSDRGAGSDNEVGCRTHHFHRISLDSGEVPVGKPMLDLNVAVLRPSERTLKSAAILSER